MENVMQGIIDMHIHAGPDVRARKLDDLELMEASVQRGVRAIVLKSHNVPTADRAYLVNRVAAEKYPDAKFTAFGGLCLNRPVGGLNPDAVETSLKLGAKVIWLPTNTAENHYRKNGKDPSKGVVVTRDGKAVDELQDIFALVKQYNAVLATGHIGAEECFPGRGGCPRRRRKEDRHHPPRVLGGGHDSRAAGRHRAEIRCPAGIRLRTARQRQL